MQWRYMEECPSSVRRAGCPSTRPMPRACPSSTAFTAPTTRASVKTREEIQQGHDLLDREVAARRRGHGAHEARRALHAGHAGVGRGQVALASTRLDRPHETQRPHRLGVRTPPFHGGNTGSNPVGDASKRRARLLAGSLLFVHNGHFEPVGFDCPCAVRRTTGQRPRSGQPQARVARALAPDASQSRWGRHSQTSRPPLGSQYPPMVSCCSTLLIA